MQGAVDAAVTVFGGLDAAIAVAGVVAGGVPLWEMGDAQWNVQFDINVHGVRHLAAAAVPVLLDAPPPRQGRVVAVASAAGLLGLRRLSGYSASKHAVIGLISPWRPIWRARASRPMPCARALPAPRSSTPRRPSTTCRPPRSSHSNSWWSASWSRRTGSAYRLAL